MMLIMKNEVSAVKVPHQLMMSLAGDRRHSVLFFPFTVHITLLILSHNGILFTWSEANQTNQAVLLCLSALLMLISSRTHHQDNHLEHTTIYPISSLILLVFAL